MTEVISKEFSRKSFLKGGGAVVAGASLAAAGVAGNFAAALPANADPASENPTISAPPPFTNDLRENSFSCIRPVITHLPLP